MSKMDSAFRVIGLPCMECGRKIKNPFVTGSKDRKGVNKYRFCSYECSQNYFWKKTAYVRVRE